MAVPTMVPPKQVDEREIESTVEVIREVGFCVVPGLISPPHCGEIRDVLMRLLKAEKKQNLHQTGHQRVLHLLVKNPIFIDLLCHPFVLAVWRRHLAPDIICSTMTANALWPKSTEQYWHVDHPYWTLEQPYPTYPLAGQVIWMIDDFTVANGATAGIPGSHLRNTLPSLEEKWTDEAKILVGQRGSVILADGLWWHTSRPNVSRKTRCAVLATYIRTHCVPQEDMRMQLASLENPSELVRRLLGANQYQSTRTFPY
jgi:ectoine hydroxylase-related dioxygenase (phytanoyl-CoA dioxygenase family)